MSGNPITTRGDGTAEPAAGWTLDDLSRRQWDAIVIGAGPAGAAAALGLARGGRAVLLVDKADWPRAKVCGGCLNAAGLAALRGLNAARALAEAEVGPTLNRLELAAGGRRARIDLTPGRAVERSPFDAALVADAVDAGVVFAPRTAATPYAPGQVTLQIRSSGAADNAPAQHRRSAVIKAELLIAAAGLAGVNSIDNRPASGAHIGVGGILENAGHPLPPGTIHMVCGRAGYVGMTRLTGGRLNLAAALRPAAIREAGGVSAAVQRVFCEADAHTPPLDSVCWAGTPALTRHVARPWADRLLAVGDAAGYVEPFTGEGMAWALAGGAALSELVVKRDAPWSPSLGEAWAREHRRLIHQRHTRCRAIAWCLHRPRLTRTAVAFLAAWPRTVRPIVRAMNRPMPSGHSPDAVAQPKGRA